jgi:hypothetical protein
MNMTDGSYVKQKEGENLASIKAYGEETRYGNKKNMKITDSVHGRNAILNEIHNMRMKVFDDR